MSLNNVSAGITGFIDILGFGDRVLSTTSIGGIDEIARRIKKIQSEFDFNTKNSLTKKDNAFSKRTVLAFSDSILVNVPFESEATEYHGTFKLIIDELVGFSHAQGKCTSDGIFLRGGIDTGWWYRSGSTLISQSLVGAYKAEGKANMPVIALTDQLFQYLLEHKDRGYPGIDDDSIERVLRPYDSEETSGRIKFWYIDYISLCVEYVQWPISRQQAIAYESASSEQSEKVMEQGYMENRCLWLERHARSIENAHASTSLDAAKKKYEWLATYHNEIASRYKASARSECNIQP